MRRWSQLERPQRAPIALLALACLACEGRPSEGEGETGDSAPYFVMGQGESGWNEIREGDELVLVLGGQGLLMFPMPIRGQGFTIPATPGNWADPNIPLLHIHLDIEGFNIGASGHFARVVNFPVPFGVLPDGSYEFVYVILFVPDELEDACDIDGLPGQLYAELDTADGFTLTWERNVVIAVPPSLCG